MRASLVQQGLALQAALSSEVLGQLTVSQWCLVGGKELFTLSLKNLTKTYSRPIPLNHRGAPPCPAEPRTLCLVVIGAPFHRREVAVLTQVADRTAVIAETAIRLQEAAMAQAVLDRAVAATGQVAVAQAAVDQEVTLGQAIWDLVRVQAKARKEEEGGHRTVVPRMMTVLVMAMTSTTSRQAVEEEDPLRRFPLRILCSGFWIG